MTDNTAPTPASYVDTYSPPATNQPATQAPVQPPVTPAAPTGTPAPQASQSFSVPPALQSAPSVVPVQPMASTPEPSTPAPAPVASTPVAPVAVPTDSVPAQPSSGQSPISQALEDQNIFFLLGVTDATEEEKESFLDELQQVIWEDFLENDVELLITEEEMKELETVMAKKELGEVELQEAIVTYLEKLIPDLEEIMLEKALELKADMVKERIAGMKEYYADKSAALTKLDEAEKLVNDDQWRQAAEALNSIT
jgi:hypothetical protein